MVRPKTRREKIRAMALQTVSPNEASVAQSMLSGPDVALTIERAETALREAKTLSTMKGAHAFAKTLTTALRAVGAGTETENRGASLILRAERAMGAELIRMAQTGERATGGRLLAGRERVTNKVIYREPSAPGLDELGITDYQASEWQRLAAIPEEKFDQLLDQLLASTDGFGRPERLSRINVVREWYGPTRKRPALSPETAENPNMAAFRTSVYGFLAPVVNDDANLSSTKNGLLQLPFDELAEIHNLLQLMVDAYVEAREMRG